MNSHDELRQTNRKLRAGLDPSRLERAAAVLCARVTSLEAYREADRIAAYFAVNGEISLDPVIDHALSEDKLVYLPNLERDSLRFSPYFRGQKMRFNRYGIAEPDVNESVMLAPRDLDLVLVPLVAFDADCNRIGMGGGFYDRSFAFRKESGQRQPLLIGVAHEMQRVRHLQPQDWDVRLDLVVTDERVYGDELILSAGVK